MPTYDRRQVQRPIVHLGVGGFHRAHQAVYLDDLAERRVTSDWGERGVGLLPGDQRMAAACTRSWSAALNATPRGWSAP
jgi:mannitol 2-dehydrogenase